MKAAYHLIAGVVLIDLARGRGGGISQAGR